MFGSIFGDNVDELSKSHAVTAFVAFEIPSYPRDM